MGTTRVPKFNVENDKIMKDRTCRNWWQNENSPHTHAICTHYRTIWLFGKI